MRVTFWIFGILTLVFYSCEPPVNQASTGGNTNNPVVDNLVEGFEDLTIEFQELTRPGYVESWVDQLIVKAQPGENMPEIGRMQEGEIATYLRQRTLRKFEFTLRGQRFNEPWILVKTKDSVMGWVHQGGIRYVQPKIVDLFDPNAQLPTMRTRSMNITVTDPEEEMFLVKPGKQVGPIKLTTTEEELVGLFGPGNVSRGQVNTSSVNIEPATLIYASTSNEIRLTWKDESRTRVKAIYIDQQGGKWKTPGGIRIGISLTDLCKINEAPVSFYGLNWEYGGTIESWKNGKLASLKKKFYIVLRPRSPSGSKDDIKRYSGNAVFTSNTVGVEKLDLVVSRIGVYLD